MQVTRTALILDEPAVLGNRLEIPLDSIHKVAVDDGTLWGPAAENHRFPVYDVHSDGSGSGALLGSFWGPVSALMPSGCRIASIEPVPELAPNLALIFESPISIRKPRKQNGGSPNEEPVLGLLLRVDDPAAARSALADSAKVADVDHGDLEYLNGGPGSRHSGNGNGNVEQYSIRGAVDRINGASAAS